jgi:serine/threonine protein kinase
MVPLFQNMLSAIAHVHSANIVHRDIKPENFLCSGELQNVKLCDFGFAVVLPESGRLTGVFGTPPYMSPEMLKSSHNTKSDIWSMGVMFFFMLSGGKYPYEPKERSSAGMKQAIKDGAQLRDFKSPQQVTVESKQLTIALLDRDPDTRLTAQEAMQHPFFWKGCKATSSSLSEMSTAAPSETSAATSERDAFNGGRDMSPLPSEVRDIAQTPAMKVMARTKMPTASKGQFVDKTPASTLIFDL